MPRVPVSTTSTPSPAICTATLDMPGSPAISQILPCTNCGWICPSSALTELPAPAASAGVCAGAAAAAKDSETRAASAAGAEILRRGHIELLLLGRDDLLFFFLDHRQRW